MYNFLIFNSFINDIKNTMKKIIMIFFFYIFGNKLKEIFVFNYKIIIINLFSKIFFT